MEMQFYEWNLMPEYLDNSTPMKKVDMVASFLKDCGYMADMDYGESSSSDILQAQDVFKSCSYNENTIRYRTKLTTLDWEDKLRAELNAERPVLLSW